MTDDDNTKGVALLGAIARGDEAALADFYRRYEKVVYRYSLSKLNDNFAAADILNEVMLEVWKAAAGRFEGRARVKTWLLGIAHHKVVDYLRKKRPNEMTELDDTLADESPQADMDQLIAGVKNARLLRGAMEKLSADHREILHLVFFEDLNYADIAGIVGVPEGTVKSRVYHAKNLLKSHLTKLLA